jgi:hypothetical protein
VSTVSLDPSTSTLRQATGQSMKRTATGSRQRKIAGLIAGVGLLVGIVVIAAALGGGRGGKPAAKPTSSPLHDRAAAPPDPTHALPPIGALPPPPPVARPEPPRERETSRAATPPTKAGPLPTPSTAIQSGDMKSHHDPSTAKPIKPFAPAPLIRKPPPLKPPPKKTTVDPDLPTNPDD